MYTRGTSNTVRNSMLEYGRHLLQDSIETNWVMDRHAHLVVLQTWNGEKSTGEGQMQLKKYESGT